MDLVRIIIIKLWKKKFINCNGNHHYLSKKTNQQVYFRKLNTLGYWFMNLLLIN